MPSATSETSSVCARSTRARTKPGRDAPSLLGEVTHYVADLSKARGLLGYSPKVSLDEGIARAVAWFKEHRTAHPEEDVPVTADHEGTSTEPVWKAVSAP